MANESFLLLILEMNICEDEELICFFLLHLKFMCTEKLLVATGVCGRCECITYIFALFLYSFLLSTVLHCQRDDTLQYRPLFWPSPVVHMCLI